MITEQIYITGDFDLYAYQQSTKTTIKIQYNL